MSNKFTISVDPIEINVNFNVGGSRNNSIQSEQLSTFEDGFLRGLLPPERQQVAYPAQRSIRWPTLPYYVPEKDLPGPIHATQIEALLNRPGRTPEADARGLPLGDHYLVKFAPEPHAMCEAINLLAVGRYTSVRVPKLYAAWSFNHGHEHVWALIMENFQGKTFEELLTDSIEREQNSSFLERHFSGITSKFRQALTELTTLPYPGFYGPVTSASQSTARAADRPLRFDTADAARRWFFDQLVPVPSSRSPRATQERISAKSAFLQLRQNGTAVFTNLTLGPSDIKIGRDGEVCFISWLEAGFYPMEFAYLRFWDVWRRKSPSTWMFSLLSSFPENDFDEARALLDEARKFENL
ncbi:hypothetical protein F5Y11DRAFT_367054 [Daldinia sp. FL1419]|nr:hypothetical protein F5Y11DRAFT_367054 [Daldinia sp. FL1419]